MQKSPLLLALTYYGETPVSGSAANPTILDFIKATSYPSGVSDEVPWCSAFLVWLFQQCGEVTPANAAALSWMNYSEHTDNPKLGDIVVLGWPKEDPTSHHVGFFIREKANVVYILAGNQNNEVDIVAWRKGDVVSYRSYSGK